MMPPTSDYISVTFDLDLWRQELFSYFSSIFSRGVRNGSAQVCAQTRMRTFKRLNDNESFKR